MSALLDMLCNMINQLFVVCTAILPDGYGFKEVLGCGKCSRNMNHLDELIWVEGEDSEEDHLKCPHPAHKRLRPSLQQQTFSLHFLLKIPQMLMTSTFLRSLTQNLVLR